MPNVQQDKCGRSDLIFRMNKWGLLGHVVAMHMDLLDMLECATTGTQCALLSDGKEFLHSHHMYSLLRTGATNSKVGTGQFGTRVLDSPSIKFTFYSRWRKSSDQYDSSPMKIIFHQDMIINCSVKL